MNNRLNEIRESERKSHIEIYSNEELFHTESWLKKPIKTVRDLLPLFKAYSELTVLDLGSGVGRNCIAIAREYQSIHCVIECVDILDIAIEKLYANAEEYGVKSNIQGIIKPIEDFAIEKGKYDLILAISALEHTDTEASFINKLNEMRDGIRENGVVCLVVNSNVREYDKKTGQNVPAQFEVNMHTDKLQDILRTTFAGWRVLKESAVEQQYDIPREFGMSDLHTRVVTYVARKN